MPPGVASQCPEPAAEGGSTGDTQSAAQTAKASISGSPLPGSSHTRPSRYLEPGLFYEGLNRDTGIHTE
ncbi:hypothetical protein DV515_00005222 [Chloebia gouldiae]|uniref:Uncharacterized protein n=1 Tax=Chloebia gouldiae TaxID=44316 RepID=A0A3L8SPP1_CHLGU|nr:hypothetical protein DV515_00005222 [Chloebia gouldiae]